MRPEQTVIFSDLDGTLFNSRSALSWENLAAVSEYLDAGGMFAIATGRAPQNALTFLWGLRQNAPAIVLNGAAAYDFGEERYLFCEHMDRSALNPLLDRAYRELPELELQVYTEREILYCLPEERCDPLLRRLHNPCRFVDYTDTLDQDVVKCLLYVRPELDEHLGALLREETEGVFYLAPGAVHVDGQDTHFYEIMPRNITKGTALQRLRKLPALADRCFIAAGDNWNDMDFLRAADVGVTPANAIPELKALSRFTTVSNDEDVAAHIIRDILPQLP